MTILPGMFRTNNQNGNEVCRHCDDQGLVVLDGDAMEGAPCPMCQVGYKRHLYLDVRRVGVDAAPAPPSVVPWWSNRGRDPDRVTWNNGLSLEHRFSCQSDVQIPKGPTVRCGYPATVDEDGRALCGLHRSVAEQGRGAAPRATFRMGRMELTPAEQASADAAKGLNGGWATGRKGAPA